jgi:hypothetical protein
VKSGVPIAIGRRVKSRRCAGAYGEFRIQCLEFGVLVVWHLATGL